MPSTPSDRSRMLRTLASLGQDFKTDAIRKRMRSLGLTTQDDPMAVFSDVQILGLVEPHPHRGVYNLTEKGQRALNAIRGLRGYNRMTQ